MRDRGTPPLDDRASDKVIPATENGQYILYDGLGNKTYFMSASVSAPLTLMPPAKASVGKRMTFRRVQGALAMVQYVEAGKIEGTATFTVSAAFATFMSDGTNYWQVS